MTSTVLHHAHVIYMQQQQVSVQHNYNNTAENYGKNTAENYGSTWHLECQDPVMTVHHQKQGAEQTKGNNTSERGAHVDST